jgi:hypothetical protein
MTHEQKMVEAIKRAPIPAAILKQLGDIPTLVGIMAATTGVLMALAATGYGAVAEAITAGLLIMGAAIGGYDVGGGIMSLIAFYQQTQCDTAQKPEDLDKAGRSFADAIAKMGVGGLTLALSFAGAEEVSEAPPVEGPPPPDPALTEAAGPAQKPWMIRPGEGALPEAARVARPGSPMELDPSVSHRYMYVVKEDGSIVYSPQEVDPVTGAEAVKHTDLAENGPAKVSGEINYNESTGQWEMDANSGRYSAAPLDPNNPRSPIVGTRTPENVQAAVGLAKASGTTADIVAKPAD